MNAATTTFGHPPRPQGSAHPGPDEILTTANQLRWDIGADFHQELMESIYTEAARIADRGGDQTRRARPIRPGPHHRPPGDQPPVGIPDHDRTLYPGFLAHHHWRQLSLSIFSYR